MFLENEDLLQTDWPTPAWSHALIKKTIVPISYSVFWANLFIEPQQADLFLETEKFVGLDLQKTASN